LDPYIYFPYEEFRGYQRELISKVFNTICDSSILFVEAPSGFGKTIALLTGAIPFIESKNAYLVYVVRTYREIDRVIDEILKISNAKNIRFSEIRAKREFCINELINENLKKNENFNLICNELVKNGLCKYFINFKNKINKLYEKLNKEKNLRFTDIINLAINLNICPFELNSISLNFSNIIILTYSSFLNSNLLSQIKELSKKYDKKILIADEAHNIFDFLMEINNFEVNLTRLENELKGEEGLIQFIMYIRDFLKNNGTFVKMSSYDFYNKIYSKLDIDTNYIYDIIRKNYKLDIVESLYNLYNILNFKSKNIDSINYYLLKTNKDIILGSFTFSNEEILNEIFTFFDSIIFSSATLQPLDIFFSFSDIKGKKYETFNVEDVAFRIRTIFIKNLSTRYVERNPELYSSFNELILEISSLTKGGLAIFFASYQVMKGILERGLKDSIDRDLIIEERKLDYSELIKQLERFYENPHSKAILAIQGGKISEGEDFPVDSIKTVILIGVPFEEPSYLLNEKINYWERKFPGKGKEYAYFLPAVRKSIQSIGRAMRRKESNLNVILADGRYSEEYLFKLLPKWLKKDMIIINYFKGKLKRILHE